MGVQCRGVQCMGRAAIMKSTYCYNVVENSDSGLPRIVEYDLQQSLCVCVCVCD